MNHWCTKQILHLVPSQNLYIWFCNISSLLPEIWYRRRTGTTSSALHYIILKYFTMNLMDGTKCKTCFGCPRMVLCGPWKKRFFKNRVWLGVIPPRFGKTPDFSVIFSVKPSLRKLKHLKVSQKYLLCLKFWKSKAPLGQNIAKFDVYKNIEFQSAAQINRKIL